MYNPNLKLGQALKDFGDMEQKDVPFWIWLFENPDSPLKFPGAMGLGNHDALHILLDRGLSNLDEAFVVGFTMGTDPNLKPWQIHIFLFACRWLYPEKYKFKRLEQEEFYRGLTFGREPRYRGLYKHDFSSEMKSRIGFIRYKLNLTHHVERRDNRLNMHK